MGTLRHGDTPERYLGTAAAPHLHGEAGSPLGPHPAASLADAAAPAALPSLFASWCSHSWSPLSLSAAPSVESAEESAVVLCRAPPGQQQKSH